MNTQETYLRAILATVARQTFTPQEIANHVLKNGGPKQVAAYNLCEGELTQGDIAKEVGLDSGNFSKTIGRWVDVGIVIRIVNGKKIIPVHVYPLDKSFVKKG